MKKMFRFKYIIISIILMMSVNLHTSAKELGREKTLKRISISQTDAIPLKELGQTINGVRFELLRRSQHKVDIVVHLKSATITMADETVLQKDGHNQVVFYPGITFKGYDYNLSPDEKWLFVDRGIFNKYAVGYLYKRNSPTSMIAIHPNGHSFYDAALRYYCKVHRLNYAKMSNGMRNVRYKSWKNDSVVFWMNAGSGWNLPARKGELAGSCYMSFNMRDNTFHILKEFKY